MYASLHNHTDHSNIRGFLDSINRVSDLIVYSQKLGHNGIAITDHDTVSNHISAIECIKELRNGTSKLYKKAPKFKPEDWNSDKFKLILGNEIYLCSRKQIEEEKDYKFYHFILLAKDKIGHRQIRELSTKAWVENSFTWVIIRTPTYFEDLFEVVEKDKGHLIASTACLGGQLPNLIWNAYCQNPDNPDYSLCYKWIKRMVKCFGVGNFFLEMQPSNQENQIIVNKALLKISEELNIPYIITLDAHYLRKEDRPIHEAFLKSDEDESKGREVGEFYATTYLMSEAEIHSYMDDYLGKENVQKGLNNTQLIWEQIEEYDLDQDLVIPYEPTDFSEVDLRLYNKYVSKIPCLKDFYESDYIADKHLVREIINRIEKDFEELGNQKTYDAINICLKVVLNTSEKTNAHWSAYLLQTRAFIDTIWESDSLCGPSRGCFVPGTKILMGDGIQKNIEDVQIGDKVVTHLGNIKTVKNTFSYDIEEDIYTIKGKNRYGIKCEEVQCTNNHKFYCWKNSSFQWIEAQDLTGLDYLITIVYKDLGNYKKANGTKLIKIESSKKSHYKGKVYDLNVEEDNSFVANGYCVHNSGGGFILLYILGITQINPLKEEVPLYYWRFLHEYRASYVDVDIDCEGSKRDTIIANLQAKYGGYRRVAKVQTILTVKAKNSILISCRGLGIPVEEAQFLSSFIGAERGIQYTLQQTYYGDEENGLAPNTEFVNLMRDKYSQVWEVAQSIEGLVSGVGQHAGGVILSPDDIVNHTALMKASSGDVITQFDLHKLEQTGQLRPVTPNCLSAEL